MIVLVYLRVVRGAEAVEELGRNVEGITPNPTRVLEGFRGFFGDFFPVHTTDATKGGNATLLGPGWLRVLPSAGAGGRAKGPGPGPRGRRVDRLDP